MGLAVAKQVVRVMDQAMDNTHAAGTMPSPLPQSYYVIFDGAQSGPYSEQEMSRLIADGKVIKDTHVWKPGMTAWQTVGNTPEVLKLVALAPPPFNKEEL